MLQLDKIYGAFDCQRQKQRTLNVTGVRVDTLIDELRVDESVLYQIKLINFIRTIPSKIR